MTDEMFRVRCEGCSFQIGMWYGDQQYRAIWHAAAPMNTMISPVLVGYLPAAVGICSCGWD